MGKADMDPEERNSRQLLLTARSMSSDMKRELGGLSEGQVKSKPGLGFL